jgi:single-strand DNA-binding protein
VSNTNFAIVQGNVTKEPYVNTLQSGSAVINFSVAVKGQYKTKAGDEKETTSFIECVKWTSDPDSYADVIKKGSPVTVIGSLEQQSWDDKKTGAKRSVTRVKADSVVPMRHVKPAVPSSPDEARNKSPDQPDQPATGPGEEGSGLPF